MHFSGHRLNRLLECWSALRTCAPPTQKHQPSNQNHQPTIKTSCVLNQPLKLGQITSYKTLLLVIFCFQDAMPDIWKLFQDLNDPAGASPLGKVSLQQTMLVYLFSRAISWVQLVNRNVFLLSGAFFVTHVMQYLIWFRCWRVKIYYLPFFCRYWTQLTSVLIFSYDVESNLWSTLFHTSPKSSGCFCSRGSPIFFPTCPH